MISLSLLLGTLIVSFGYAEDKSTTKSPLPSSLTITPPPSPTTTTTTTIKPDGFSEDLLVLNETITKYGLPQNYKELNLPGPEIATDKRKYNYNNTLDNYILKIRTITKNFSYNARFEKITFKWNDVDNTVVPIIKGQFTEHFERKSGGFYIRTIGYTLNENGFKQFLIDLTVAQTKLVIPKTPPFLIISGLPKEDKTPISSTVLLTLTGGNSLG